MKRYCNTFGSVVIPDEDVLVDTVSVKRLHFELTENEIKNIYYEHLWSDEFYSHVQSDTNTAPLVTMMAAVESFILF